MHTYRALVIAQRDPGERLPGVVIEHAGRNVGETSVEGALGLQFHGVLGEHIALKVHCPAHHHPVGPALEITVRALEAGARLPEYRVECRPELRSVVVAVRSPKASALPVRYLDREIARTDGNGSAHALIKAAPGETLKLKLDTSDPRHRQLRPQNPELTYTVSDRDEVVLFDQTFSVLEPKRPAPVGVPLPNRF